MRQGLIEGIKLMALVPAAMLCLGLHAQAQKADTPYASMAPLEQYLMTDRDAEIALARSAAPKGISDDAEVMVFDRQGYKTVVKGTNGFVCMVQRSWAAGIDDAEFWNPKLRAPICFNPPAARTYLPIIIARTKLVLAGKSKAQVFDAVEAALNRKELPGLETGSMCYMMSRDGYLHDDDPHWHPHLMFFIATTEAKSWGADVPGSPIIAAVDTPDRLTVFLVPVGKWSDGSADSR